MAILALAPAGAQDKPVAQGPSQRPSINQPRMRASAQRNENVAVNPIDNNAIKEANVRLGASATIVSEARADSGYYATEFGRPASGPVALDAAAKQPSWHGEGWWWHQNSVLNARTFFQVGGVKPAHRNIFGGRFTGEAGPLGYLTGSFAQRHIRGMVNGNVLVPLASERTPLATDPEVRAMVQRFLDAFPAEAPNRPDFDFRALNTNAPQRIDEIDGSLRLDRDVKAQGRLTASYTLLRSRTAAFQLVDGQNPDSFIHTHRAGLTYAHRAGPDTEIVLGMSFQRVASLLVAEPNAVGPRVRFGFQWEELGPESEFPIDRAQNSYRYGGSLSKRLNGGRHQLMAGADLTRYQLNGIETNNQRGYYSFTNNFGRSATENARWGAPSYYEITMGELARGFRTWTANAFVADRWRPSQRIQVDYGLRYNLVTGPTEVNGLNAQPYACDCNNFSPRLALAWVAGRGWTMRSSYTVSFGRIEPVTYQQIRNNAPLVRYVQVQNPDLLDPLRGIDLGNPNGRTSPTVFSADMVSPYAHQYSVLLERRFAKGSMLRLGYLGSRSLKLLNTFIQNRADQVPGIKATLDNVDQRRPDQRYYEVRRVLNGGRAYFDAAQVSFDQPVYRGLRMNVVYTFGKAIDEGSDFAFTAANRDMQTARSQWQYDSFNDKKGLSNFDSPHSLLLSGSWDLPGRSGSRMSWLTGGWQISGVTLWKRGTPLTLYMGSDAPGFGNVDGGPSDRPHILDPTILGMTISHPDAAPQILRRDRFAYIAEGEHRGSIGRGTFRKASIANLNAAVTKRWNLGTSREWVVLLRAEAYNLTNTPQFDEPQRNYTSPSFGKITNSLNDGRVFQLGLRLVL